MDDSITVQ